MSPPAPEAQASLAPPPRPALFLDRDGVLNEEVDYLHDPRNLVMIAGAGPVIAACNHRRIPVVVVSNQAGIGRGYYAAAAFSEIAAAISRELGRERAHVDGWYFCPHHPDEGCACRKPRPGLLYTAATELGLDLGRSVLVGDKASDLEAARAAGLRAVLVRTGYGREEERALRAGGRASLFDACFDSLAGARESLLGWLAAPAAARGA